MRRFGILLVLIFFGLTSIQAQMNTEEALNLVKTEGFVFRINTYKVTLDSLNNLIETGELPQKTRSRLKEHYESTLVRAQRTMSAQMTAFIDEFDFSKVYFVPDYLFKNFVEGERENVFLDTEYELYTDRSIGERFVFGYNVYEDKHATLHLRHSEYIPEKSAYKSVKGEFPKHIGFPAYNPIKSIISFFQTNFRKRIKSHAADLNNYLEELSST